MCGPFDFSERFDWYNLFFPYTNNIQRDANDLLGEVVRNFHVNLCDFIFEFEYSSSMYQKIIILEF